MTRHEQRFVRDKKGSVFAAIVVILFILTMIGMSGLLYWEKEKISEKYFSEIKQAKNEKNELKDVIAKLEKDKTAQTVELRSIKEQYNNLNERYTKLDTNYKEAMQIKEYITKKLDEYQMATAKGFENLTTLNAKFDVFMDEVKGQTEKKKLTYPEKEKIRQQRTKKEVELPAVVVKENEKPIVSIKKEKTETALPEKAELIVDARVMSYNSAHNFVVINKGLVDGVKVGDIFTIMRNEREITDVTISELRDFVSLGVLKEADRNIGIKDGDSVRKKE